MTWSPKPKRVQVMLEALSLKVCKQDFCSTSQSFTVLSSPPETMCVELEDRDADRTQFECPANAAAKRRSANQVSFTDLSSEAVRSKRSSVEMSQQRTGLKCNFNIAGVCLFSTGIFQMATVESVEAETSVFPDPDALMHVMDPDWPASL